MEGENKPESKQGNKYEGKAILSYFLGVMTSVCVVCFGLKQLADNVGGLIAGFVLFIVFSGVTFFLLSTYKDFFFKKILGLSRIDKNILRNSSKSLLGNLVSGNFSGAEQDIDPIFEKLSAWYAWVSYRNWVITVFYSLFLVFVGLLGSVLIYNQNDLITQQNTIIERQDSVFREQNALINNQNALLVQQVNLAEGSRRSSLVFLTNDVINKFQEELERKPTLGVDCLLSQTLIARIATLSQSFRPYRYLHKNRLIESPLSPERGQLLMVLAKSPLPDGCYEDIHDASSFSYADFFGANLKHSKLTHAYLANASFLGADLYFADLSNANLLNADLTGAYLDKANLSGVKNLTKAQLLKARSLHDCQGLPDTLLAALKAENKSLFTDTER